VISPQRVVIYRYGVSEGMFDSLLSHEVAAIRSALLELSSCPERAGKEGCTNDHCVSCRPPITYIVAHKDHNTKIVPARRETNHRGKITNVPSGTVVDSPDIMSFQNGLALSTGERSEGFDFFLTSQGGLKGTSKAMMYRVLVNDNFDRVPMGLQAMGRQCTPLTREKLYKMTYFMAFQCKY
jgi:eukaryotic translation initiation factor 2C